MTVKNIRWFILLMSISTSILSSPEIKSFDAFCSLIQDTIKLELNPQARLEYINKNFDSKVHSSDVRESYDLIFQIAPNKRYQVFKESVQSTTGETWKCPALYEFFK